MALINENRIENILELELDFSELNTLTLEALSCIRDVLQNHAKDDSLRVLIISSASKKYFSNGLDPFLFLDKSEKEIKENFRVVAQSSEALMRFPCPVIFKIEGHCMAMGAAYAIAVDYRFMVKDCGRIGFPESLIAMNFPAISFELLKDLVGYQKARDLLYSGISLKSGEALKAGLIDKEIISEEINDVTFKFARSLAKLTKESSHGMKAAMGKKYRLLAEMTNDWESQFMVDALKSQNAQEGFRSIVEKRRPKFTN